MNDFISKAILGEVEKVTGSTDGSFYEGDTIELTITATYKPEDK